MNPAFDCPYDTPIEEMKRYIEEYSHPALLIDEKGKVLARNSLADYKVAPVRLGAYIKSLMHVQELEMLRNMHRGEIRSIQLKTENIANAVVVRFKGFYFIGWLSTRAGLTKSVLDVNSEVGKGSFGVLDFCSGLDENEPYDMLKMKQLTSEQLCRQMNLGRMLEIVTDTNIKPQKTFNPYNSVKAVCDIATEVLGEGNPSIRVKLDGTLGACNGIEEDYCSAVAAMLAFAIKHCAAGGIWVDGTLTDRKYRLSVSFKSDISVQELEEEQTAHLKADLLYIRCIAENGLWGFSVDKTASGEARLNFSVPLYAMEVMPLMQPAVYESLRAVVKTQLVFLRKKG